ncbi:MAG: hypothetical protein Q8908_04855 [Bacteroidota bacterium]|nr:hypothetical protein [Bacteroidota bacterium]
MKTLIMKFLKKRIFYGVSALFLLFFLSSCGKKIIFPISTVIPSASASVTIKTDKNKNYNLNVVVKHMAGPERLTPPRQNYVVWIGTTEKGNMNMGRLSISKGLTGSVKVVTPFKPNVVFISAEDDSGVTTPGDQVVLKTNSFDL